MTEIWRGHSEMIDSICHYFRARTVPAALLVLALLLCPGARGTDKDKDKDKSENDKKAEKDKPKKQKIEPWIEVRTTHFIVASDGGEKTARRFAAQFETLLRIFQATLPKARVTNGLPVRLLVARDGESFARVVPEFPFSKTRDQPSGLFVSGPEKTYIIIRANAGGKFVFQDIYHDYARTVLQLSYHSLPPWIEEGYASVYNSVTFNERGSRLERPDPNDMSTLFESPLLPLDLVLGADRQSPYYSPGNKDTVFFAEARVLLQYLITEPAISGTGALDRYLTEVTGGTGLLQAARDAFGDLNQLQSKLETYVHEVNGPPYDFAFSNPVDVGGPPRLMTEAESEARIADFHSLRGRDSDAEDSLEDALMKEPGLAEAEQDLGFVELKRENLSDAEQHLERAIQLDPKDALNFYGLGLVAVDKAGHEEVPGAAVDAFEKSVALNADFAPAWFNLAQLYAERDNTLPKALNASQRAAALAPGKGEYQLLMASILNQMGRAEGARKTASEVKDTAADRKTADKAGELVSQISSPKQKPGAVTASYPAAPATAAPAKPAESSMPKLERRTEPDAKPASTTSASNSPAPVPAAASTATVPAESISVYARVYSMIGTISEVTCSLPPQILLTLKSMTIALKLHAENFDKLSIKSAETAPPAKENSCAGLRGRTARISYHLVSDKGWDGEIQDVELRGQ